MSTTEIDTARTRRALAAAERGDRAAFQAEWDAMTEAERWAMRGHARVEAIRKHQRLMNEQEETP